MKHHFGDLLDRDGGYWTVVPNRERYAYEIDNVPSGSKEIRVATIGKDNKNWEKIFTFPNLEELTLHEPSKVQLEAISKLASLKRLRITHARLETIEFIAPVVSVEELVLEYVSGFSDLAPLRLLKNLRSLHLENLRRVKDFGGLSGIESLRYLCIDGTLDWKQPIADFIFLKGLPNLEVLFFGQVINNSPFPALLPLLGLKKLKKIRVPRNMFATNEYALLETGIPNVEGAFWEPCSRYAYSQLPLPKDDIRAHLPDEIIRANHQAVTITYKGERLINDPEKEIFEFLGKGAGSIKCLSPKAQAKCNEFIDKYESMKNEARKYL